jgi:GTP-binding protein
MVDELLKAADRSRLTGSDATTTTTAPTTLNRLMDSGELEMERGITITSKVTRLAYRPSSDSGNANAEPFILNIVDTPGHADFCGEVRRDTGRQSGIVVVTATQRTDMPFSPLVCSVH